MQYERPILQSEMLHTDVDETDCNETSGEGQRAALSAGRRRRRAESGHDSRYASLGFSDATSNLKATFLVDACSSLSDFTVLLPSSCHCLQCPSYTQVF